MTVLVDTSAWVEYVRATGSPTHLHLRRVVEADEQPATTDPVVLELLATATSRTERWQLRTALDSCDYIPQVPRRDVDAAVDLYQHCRSLGHTPRSSTDCLIAAIAMRHDVPVLHRDRDFDVIASLTPLRVVRVG